MITRIDASFAARMLDRETTRLLDERRRLQRDIAYTDEALASISETRTAMRRDAGK